MDRRSLQFFCWWWLFSAHTAAEAESVWILCSFKHCTCHDVIACALPSSHLGSIKTSVLMCSDDHVRWWRRSFPGLLLAIEAFNSCRFTLYYFLLWFLIIIKYNSLWYFLAQFYCLFLQIQGLNWNRSMNNVHYSDQSCVGADIWLSTGHQVRQQLYSENKLAHILWRWGCGGSPG